MNALVGGCCVPLVGSAANVGCGPVGCVVGAEALGEAAGVWVKARFWQDGPFLKATVYTVTAGNPKVVELSVDLRPITRALMALHARQHGMDALRQGNPSVGWSLGKLWKGAKNAAKAIGRSKLVKGVASVAKATYKVGKAVVKSKAFGAVLGVAAVFPLTAPFAAPALGAYAAANTAVKAVEVGSKVIRTASAAASTIKRGVSLAKRITTSKAISSAAVSSAGATMSPAAKARSVAATRAAANVQLTATAKARIAARVSRMPPGARSVAATKVASGLSSLARVRAQAALAKTLPPAAGSKVLATTKLEVAGAPLLKRAADTAKKLRDPATRAALLAARAQAGKAEELLASVQANAKTGSLDAQKSAIIVDLVARNRRRIQAMAQTNAGGLPGILITPEGKLVRGRFRVQTTAAAGGLLYRGQGELRQRGAFSKVAGELPDDGVRMVGPGPNAYAIYGAGSVSGCSPGCGCSPCQAAAPI